MTTTIIMQTLVYWIAGYALAYMVVRPQALIDAISAGPGMSEAGWAFHRKHYKLTYPSFAALGAVLCLAVMSIPETRH